ncbi:MAG: DUF2252 domain-containing protein [Actinomycetes bacterium]
MTVTTGRGKTAAPLQPRRGGGRTRVPRQLSRDERAALGKAARAAAPLVAHAQFEPGPEREDPVALLERQAQSRVPDLVPIRYGRMLVSAFTYYRGAALPMAADLADTPTSGLRVQLCGDAHLSNFGAFASPERRLMFDLNDFDETLPGPFEWDVKRLAASLAVAGRGNGYATKERRKILLAAAETYRTAMRSFAQMRTLDVWYAHLDIERALEEQKALLSRKQIKRTEAAAVKARTQDSTKALNKLTAMVDGVRRIVSDPPLIVPVEEVFAEVEADALYDQLRKVLTGYGRTLQSDRRHLLGQFRLLQMAHKVVGVGSVGTRAWVVLMDAGDGVDPLFLQAKEAQRSVLEEYAGRDTHNNQGERVVAGQHLMQAVSDIFLGWERVQGVDGKTRDFYIRQLRDWKYSAPIEQMVPTGMAAYGRLCGWTLARAHARSGDRMAIGAYLGSSDKFENAVADFAETYADQNERDFAALTAAAKEGRIEVKTGL